MDSEREDRPKYDGSKRRAVLAALQTDRTVADVAAALGWKPATAKSWVHWLVNAGQAAMVRQERNAKSGQLVGVYRATR